MVSADPNVEPDERAVALVGFEITEDPAGATLVLETNGDLDIVITG